MEGALCEPLSVGLYAVEKSGARLGQSAVIFGSGCIGLVTMLVLKAVGVSDITVVDIVQKRLDTALALGARQVVRGDQGGRCKYADNGRLRRRFRCCRQSLDRAASLAGGGVERCRCHYISAAADPVIGMDIGTMASREARLETIFRYATIIRRPSRLSSPVSFR